MKILATALIATLLVGCAALFPPKFDNNEYEMFVDLSTNAALLKDECATSNVTSRLIQMHEQAYKLDKYSSNLANNEELSKIAKIVHEDVVEMLKRKSVKGLSTTYCELKAKQLSIKLDRVIESIGKLR